MFEGFVADRKPLRLASFPRRFHACSQRGLLGRWKGAEVDSLTRCYSRKEAHTGGDFIGKRKSVAAWLLLDVGINCAVDELKLSSNEEHFLFSNLLRDLGQLRGWRTTCLRPNLDINPSSPFLSFIEEKIRRNTEDGWVAF